MDLSGRKILVTGGAVRIGRAICEKLADCGCTLVIHYRNSARKADGLLRQIVAAGGQAFCVQADLSTGEGCRGLISDAVAVAGGLDALVNNASVFHKHDFMQMREADLRSEVDINAFGPILLSQEFAIRFKQGAGAGGCIVNLLDRRVAGYERGDLPYMLSKKMLAEFTKLAALELAPAIRVNAVAPGPVLPPPGKGDAYVHDLAGATPLQRRPAPADVAEAVAYLLGAEAVTGQTIFVDGGQRLA